MLEKIQNNKPVKFYPIDADKKQSIHDQKSCFQLKNKRSLQLENLSGTQGYFQDEEIQFNSLFQYSQRKVLKAQQIIVQSNFEPPLYVNNNLNESQQLESQSLRVSRPFFMNPSNQQLKFQFGQEQNQCQTDHKKVVQIFSFQQMVKKQERKQVQRKNENIRFNENSQQRVQSVQKRVSIFVENQNKLSVYKQINFCDIKQSDGLIPLRSAFRPESIVIHTYRMIKNRMDNLEHSRQKNQISKKKNGNAKKQESRFKGTIINYDYDGEPIPLRGFKKTQVTNVINSNNNNLETVTVTPLPENIILPSTTNKKRLQKRKARYLANQEQKQNQKPKHNQFQQIIYYQGSDFIKKIPETIKKKKIFQNQKQRNLVQRVTFSQFKKNLNKIKGITTHQDQQKPQIKLHPKFNQINQPSIKQFIKPKKRSKKYINLSSDKVVVNQKVFQKAFNIYQNDLNDEEPNMRSSSVNKLKQKKIQFQIKQTNKQLTNVSSKKTISSLSIYNIKKQSSRHISTKNLQKYNSSLHTAQSKHQTHRKQKLMKQKISILRKSENISPQKNNENPNNQNKQFRNLFFIKRNPFQYEQKIYQSNQNTAQNIKSRNKLIDSIKSRKRLQTNKYNKRIE